MSADDVVVSTDQQDLQAFPDRLSLGQLGARTVADFPSIVRRLSAIRVLVVVDTEIGFSPGMGFGVSRFVRLLRETGVGCSRFVVDVAVRSNEPFVDNGAVPAGEARYRGFRFDSQVGRELVLNRYDELFLFGFKPDNFAGPDDNIVQPGALPASDTELARLTGWMNGGGGVFATGDHDYLGASMCHRIPRVRTMRKWTNAQGVPPIDGLTRLDTNQPATPAQHAGAVIPNGVETDAVPQPIEWVPERWRRVGLVIYKSPHELLCHPTHGPIDVMPDHPHEGLCFERDEINELAKLDFGEDKFDEYPAGADGHRGKPKVIAYGHVVPDPPFNHAKGDVNPFRIPMISAYDGWASGVGRVVVDSTWHHWFDLNILGLEAAADQANWQKISRYFVNVAKWIARPGTYRARCWWEIVVSHFEYPGIEEYGSDTDRLGVGGALRDSLAKIHGPCTVTELILETICEIHPALCALIDKELVAKVPPDPCLSCPPFEVIERVVLAGFVEGTRGLARKIHDAIDSGDVDQFEIEVVDVERAAMSGAAEALVRFGDEVAGAAERVAEVFRGLQRNQISAAD